MGKIYKNGVPYTNDANTFSTELTWEEYSQLTDAEKMNGMYYYITNIDPFVESVAPHGFTPIGTIISVMGKTAPKNYLACDGTVYNISEFPELAHYFAEQFGSNNYFGGDGTTTFAVPDLRGEFLRGTGTNSHTTDDGYEGSGADVGVHQAATNYPYMTIAGNTYRIFKKQSGYSGNLFTNADASYNSPALTYYSDLNTTFKTEARASSVYTYRGTVRPTNTSVLYCIASRNIYLKPENDYSTDEQVVGTWINGKPIYQKTVNYGVLPNLADTAKDIAHNILNVDAIWISGGFAVNAQGFANQLNLSGVENGEWYFGVDKTIIRCSTKSDRSNYSAYVTIQYTKTTD